MSFIYKTAKNVIIKCIKKLKKSTLMTFWYILRKPWGQYNSERVMDKKKYKQILSAFNNYKINSYSETAYISVWIQQIC